jgi:hypothetical protein
MDMQIKLSSKEHEALSDISSIVDEGDPVHPTLYKHWDDGKPLPSSLSLSEEEWMTVIGDCLAYDEWNRQVKSLMKKIVPLANNPADFEKRCMVCAGLISGV